MSVSSSSPRTPHAHRRTLLTKTNEAPRRARAGAAILAGMTLLASPVTSAAQEHLTDPVEPVLMLQQSLQQFLQTLQAAPSIVQNPEFPLSELRTFPELLTSGREQAEAVQAAGGAPGVVDSFLAAYSVIQGEIGADLTALASAESMPSSESMNTILGSISAVIQEPIAAIQSAVATYQQGTPGAFQAYACERPLAILRTLLEDPPQRQNSFMGQALEYSDEPRSYSVRLANLPEDQFAMLSGQAQQMAFQIAACPGLGGQPSFTSGEARFAVRAADLRSDRGVPVIVVEADQQIDTSIESLPNVATLTLVFYAKDPRVAGDR